MTPPDPDPDPIEVTRSEEELVVSTRAVPIERVRLVKRIVTESVTVTTEVRREELVVEREPAAAEEALAAPGENPPPTSTPRRRDRLRSLLADRRPGGSRGGEPFDEAEVEIVLMEELVEVTKRVVPRERIRISKHNVTDKHTIDETVRKEAVSINHTPTEGATP